MKITITKLFAMLAMLSLLLLLGSHRIVAQTPPDGINAVAWSPDGTKLAIGGTHGLLQIRNTDGSLVVDLSSGGTAIFASVAWSPDSRRIAAVGNDSGVHIWNVGDPQFDLGELIFTFEGHYDGPRAVAWSPDGTKLASVSLFDTYQLMVWDAATYQTEPIAKQATANLYTVEWSPDGSQIAVGSSTGILVFDSTLNIMPYAIASNHRIGSDDYVVAITWSPDGNTIVGGYPDGTVLIYDIVSRNQIGFLQGHTALITAIAWSPDGSMLATASQDGTLRIWDADSRLELESHMYNGLLDLTSIAWSPDGTQIAYGGAGNTFEIIPAPGASPTCDHDIPPSDTATLISTITTANGSGNPTTICLAQDSTYTFTTANNYLNALPYITGDITIEGNNATITRSGTEAFRFFEVETGGKLTLNDLNLSNGDVTGENERGGALMNDGGETILNNVTFDGNVGVTGGAIDNEEGTLTINDSTFTNNVGAYGGAIDNDDVATLTISGSTFTTNSAAYNGGAIHNDGGTLTVSSSTFTTNTADEYGGAIDNDDGDVTINASIFTSNSSEGGGAIRNDGTLTINAGSAFNTNSATNLGWGGAIYNKTGTTLDINGTDFSGNTAADVGGAIRNQGDLTVTTGTFDGNTAAEYGGAIYNTGGTVDLSGVEITDNTATTKDAGGVYGNSSSSLSITDSTLSGNDSGRRGGGIWSSGTATLTNVSITNNTAVVEGGGVYGSSSATISAGNSCISGNSSRAVYSASSSNQNFENNWWGATDGPGGSGSGSGDAVNSAIDYDPFITTNCPLP